MSEQTRGSHPIYNLFPEDVEEFDSLAELALDMRWTWNHATDQLWRQLDPVLWDRTHHPCDVLRRSPERRSGACSRGSTCAWWHPPSPATP